MSWIKGDPPSLEWLKFLVHLKSNQSSQASQPSDPVSIAFVTNSDPLPSTISDILLPFIKKEDFQPICTITGMEFFWNTLFPNRNAINCLAIGHPNSIFDILIDVSKTLCCMEKYLLNIVRSF
jgi:hypothetical protein